MNVDERLLIFSQLKGVMCVPCLDTFVRSEFRRNCPEFGTLQAIVEEGSFDLDLLNYLIELNHAIKGIRNYMGLQTYHYEQLEQNLSNALDATTQRPNEF